MASEGVDPRHQRFAEEYAIDFDPIRAYRAAGYKARSDNGVAASASRLLRTPFVKSHLKKILTKAAAKIEINIQRNLDELALIAYSDIGEILDFSGETLALRKPCDIPERARRAIASIRVKKIWEGSGDDRIQVETISFQMWDKLSALDKLMRRLGAYLDSEKVNETPPVQQGYAIDKLNLPLEVRKILRDAIRQANGTAPIPLNGEKTHESEAAGTVS